MLDLFKTTRYGKFNKNTDDTDSVLSKPTWEVQEFQADLKRLFGKFKGQLDNPEFIKGVAQIMVNWKSLLRSQLDNTHSKTLK